MNVEPARLGMRPGGRLVRLTSRRGPRVAAGVVLAASLLAVAPATADRQQRWQRVMEAGRAAEEKGDFESAQHRLTRALRLAGTGADDEARRLESLEELGDLYRYRLKREREALTFYEAADALRVRSGATTGSRAAETRSALVAIYVSSHQWAKAAAVEQREIAEIERREGVDAQELVGRLTYFAYLLGHTEPGSPAVEAALLRAAKLAGGAEREDDAFSSAGRFYQEQGDHEAASYFFARASEALERQPAPWHHRLADRHRELGESAAAAGRPATALAAYQRALALDEQRLGPRHPLLGQPLADVARLLVAEGRHAEAKELLERSLAVSRAAGWTPRYGVATALEEVAAALGEPPPPGTADTEAADTGAAGKGCACEGSSPSSEIEALRQAGEVDRARALAEKAVVAAAAQHGEQSEEVAAALDELSGLLGQLDNPAAAQAAARRYDILVARRGLTDPEVARAAGRAALSYATAGDDESAARYYAAEVESLQRAGTVDWELADALEDLGNVRRRVDRSAEAVEDYRLAVDVWTRVAGEEAPEVLEARQSLGWALIDVARYEEAETVLRAQLERIEGTEIDSKEEELLLDRLFMSLRRVCEATGRAAEAEELERRRMALHLYD